ncbi:jg20633 [Pararge aegeria aegeria]|uniref:Jg20633 protein n=1 Tax=Pararge aegeria aegeria TaxID=348720 RepID=A0A8S4REG7_9NEOP|nr:jg20633 [Pararge aegeria aegeria]
MKIPVRKSCLSLIVLSALVEVIRANENANSSEEVRKGRVNGRIVKLYSGYKPDPVLCTEDGFKADPVQCSVFYRCLKSSSGKFTVFKFQCGPGTVYDPETEVCNHPSSAKRSECGGIKSHVERDNENENEIEQHELPSPISTNSPVYTSDSNKNTYEAPINPNLSSSSIFITSAENAFINLLTTSSTPYQVGTNNKEVEDINKILVTYPRTDNKNTTQQKTSSTTMFQILENRQACTSEGFMGDSENCKTFYRCVSNLRGGFIRYEFQCSDPTVWDDYMQSCNHPWAVRNGRCGRGDINNENHEEASNILNDAPLDLTDVNSGATHPEISNRNSSEKRKKNESSANYGDQLSNFDGNSIEKNQINSESQFNQPTKVVDKNGETDEIINIDDINNNYNFGQKLQATDFTNKFAENSAPQYTGMERHFICTHSGFFGDYNDCQKFYRCVENGKGSFKKYEFTCSEGTVWDKKLESCNYAWAVKECGGTSTVDSLTAALSTTSTSTSDYALSETGDNGYTNQVKQEHEPPTTITVNTPVSLISTTEASKDIGTDCTTTGFIGDMNDCKKFYRCVDNGRGTFTKYEYKCGDGTLWDQSIEACNHAWAVNTCKIVLSSSTIRTTSVSAAQQTSTTERLIQPTTPDKSQDYNEAYGPQDVTPLDPGINLHSTLAPMISQKTNCESTGFIGDTNDCKKFYRCVNNGQRGFIKYEFFCGEGTVWDPEIQACNHAWAVKHCGTSIPLKNEVPSSSVPNIHTPTNTPAEGTTTAISSIKTTTTVSEEISEYDSGYGQQQSVSTKRPDIDSDTTTLKQIHSQSNKCEVSGFIGDVDNCNKFFRCVDNGNGGFIRHEFSCGEGTLWDPEIEACNHAWAVKNCGGSMPAKENILTSSTTNLNIVESNNEYVTQNNMDSESTTPYSHFQTTAISNINENKECTTNGFMSDKSDCKKFYRCIDSGNGKYTRYDFTCGEGTLWDPQMNACNHAWAVKGCKNSNVSDISAKPTSNPSSGVIIDQTTQTHPHSNNYMETTIPPSSSASSISVTNPSKECESSGFMNDVNDCQKFYRCVDNGNGGFVKHEFMCGTETVWDSEIEACNHKWAVANCGNGTAWDANTQSCNHLNTVEACKKSPNIPEINPIYDEQSDKESDITKTTTLATTSTTDDLKQNICKEEGYFGDKNNCKNFYRCVHDQDGYTKYDFTCGDGTIWDQDIIACNHPYDVKSPSCRANTESTLPTSTISTSPAVISTTTASNNEAPLPSTETEKPASASSEAVSNNNETKPNCNNSTIENNKNDSKNFTCTKAGFYSDPNNCKKFYRCVDWENNGQKFSIYHFDCADGTIWDPALETCNHEDSVYPPRNCNGTKQQNENTTGTSLTTEQTTTTSYQSESTTTSSKPTKTTTQSTTTTERTTTKAPTTQTSTTKKPPTQSSTTKQSTTQSSTTEESTKQSSTTEESTTHSTSTEESTTQSTTEVTTTQQTTVGTSTTNEQSTQPVSTTTETDQDQTTKSSTFQSTNEDTTTLEPSTTTTQMTTSTTDQTSTTTEQSTSTVETSSASTTEPSTTTTQMTTSTTDETSTTTEQSTSTVETSSASTTESNQESSTEQSNNHECPDTADDQSLYVCPTSFKRHPKYCNLFYQCTEDNDSHELKIAVFNCPNNTIYDESKIQCVEKEKSSKKCNGQISQKYRVKRLGAAHYDQFIATKESMACRNSGHFPFEKHTECSSSLLKCELTKSGKLRGFVYRCPEGFVYWNISRRCEPITKVRDCKRSSYPWKRRYDIPLEKFNIAS